MKIGDVMTSDVFAVGPDMPVGEVAKILINNKLHGVPVVVDGKPSGIITETDFFTKGDVTIYLPEYIDLLKKDSVLQENSGVQKEKLQALLNASAKDIMSTPCITIDEDADIDEFLGLVKGRKLSSVPVVNSQGMLCGIITLSDVISLIRI
ncbi:MAG: CBS protein [uncultured bacterium]|nr:MAG: CBS protein [uncultured bacterium]